MSDFDIVALMVLAVFAALPGLMLGLTHGQPRKGTLLRTIGAVVAAVAISGLLLQVSHTVTEALFHRPDVSAIMERAFPEDFFHGALRIPIGFAIFCGAAVPLAFTIIRWVGIPAWLVVLPLPGLLDLGYLTFSYWQAMGQPTAPLDLRMWVEGATTAAAHLIWVVYFLIMQQVSRLLRPDLPRG